MLRIVKDSSNMLFIGEYANDKDGLRLGKVRVLTFVQGQDGRPMINVGELVGKPERVYFPASVVSWDVSEEGLISAYRESVSGLVLPRSGGEILPLDILRKMQ